MQIISEEIYKIREKEIRQELISKIATEVHEIVNS